MNIYYAFYNLHIELLFPQPPFHHPYILKIGHTNIDVIISYSILLKEKLNIGYYTHVILTIGVSTSSLICNGDTFVAYRFARSFFKLAFVCVRITIRSTDWIVPSKHATLGTNCKKVLRVEKLYVFLILAQTALI